MINQKYCTVLSCLLLLMVCSGLQLPGSLIDCRPCSCQPDPHYGGTLANCSYRGLRRVSLPDPGNITTLLFDYGDVYVLKVSDFKDMFNLNHLSMRGNSLTTIERAHSVVFTNLEYLDLSRNMDLGLPQIVKILSWLRNGTLRTIFLDFIITLKSSIVPLDGLYCSSLQHSALKELHLDGNAFTFIGKLCFSSLPNTLEVLTLRYTMLGDYDVANITGLLCLKHLRILDVTGYRTWNPGRGHGKPLHTTDIPSVLFVMPSIEVIRIGQAFLNLYMGSLTLLPIRNNLTTVDLSVNQIASLTGPFRGFANVDYIDVSQNVITKLGKTLFTRSNKLRFVNLSNNDLGQCLKEDTSSDIFQHVYNLEVLDISRNRITFLPKSIFKVSVNLHYLNISGNYLTNFDVDISNLKTLTELNLKNNKLDKLPHGIMEQLNLLPNVTIILDDNPLVCSCDTLYFLEWMRDSKKLKPMGNQTCRFTNGSNINLQHLGDILSSLHEGCKSDLVLIVSSVSGATLLLLLFSGFMVYRHRWWLRYLFHVGRNKYLLVNNEDDLDIYTYDAFISYADNDRTFVIKKLLVELEDKSGLKVCIHNRDFLPGDIISENIINAIQHSRKTVIVLSPEFLKSEWCIYEFNMTRLDGISRKLNNLLVILLNEVDVKQLPKDVALMMTTNSCLEYSTDRFGEHVFWSTVTKGLKILKRLE